MLATHFIPFYCLKLVYQLLFFHCVSTCSLLSRVFSPLHCVTSVFPFAFHVFSPLLLCHPFFFSSAVQFLLYYCVTPSFSFYGSAFSREEGDNHSFHIFSFFRLYSPRLLHYPFLPILWQRIFSSRSISHPPVSFCSLGEQRKTIKSDCTAMS